MATSVALGIRLGSGTCSSAAYRLQHRGARFASGDLTGVVGVPNSIHAGKAVRRLGIRPGTLSQLAPLDPTVDSADELGPRLNLVKGLGGAQMRWKMVARASAGLGVIVDHTKLFDRLAERAPSPVEVVSLEFDSHWQWLAAQGADPEVRRNASGDIHEIGDGLIIADCRFVNGWQIRPT